MEDGKIGLITGGQNRGQTVRIKAIKTTRSREPNKVSCDLKGREFDTVKDYVFVVGQTKPLIKIGD
jgi:small subunit ribosomal protein S4e